MRGRRHELALAGAGALARARRTRPALTLYLLALLALPIKWGSPLSDANARSGWFDVLLAAALAAWLLELAREPERRRSPRAWELTLAGFVALGAVSAAHNHGGWTTVLLMAELAACAVLTADLAAEPAARRAIVRAVLAGALLTIALSALALVLFYAGVHTSLTGAYGEQFVASSHYTRIDAGLTSPPLLASYCIFASAVVAQADAAIPARLRLFAQLGLGLVCALTLSRGLIGFGVALALRSLLPRESRRAAALAAAVVVAALALLAGLSAGRLHIDPSRPASVSYTVPDPGNRREAFVSSLHTLGHHPLLGSGPGSLPGRNAGSPFRAHMTALQVAATLGLPALALLLAALALLWRGRRRPTEIATWSGLAGLGIDALAQDADHFRHVWILLGLAGV